MWRTAKVARLLRSLEPTAARARVNPSFHTRQQASNGPPSSHLRPGPPNELPRVQWTMPSGDHNKRVEFQANDPSTIELVEIHKGDQAFDSVSTEGQLTKKQIGENISRRDKIKYLLGLDQMVTLWHKRRLPAMRHLLQSSPPAPPCLMALKILKRLFMECLMHGFILQKDEQWHRIVQVIKWMLSKGQGTTTGTYEQLIRALEKDYRAEEAHSIWVQKFSYDLHSAPWTVCDLMISIYYRNNMLERLVKAYWKKKTELWRSMPICLKIVVKGFPRNLKEAQKRRNLAPPSVEAWKNLKMDFPSVSAPFQMLNPLPFRKMDDKR